MGYFRFREYSPDVVKTLAAQFTAAKPFPHIVLDDVILTPPDPILEAFPNSDWDGWSKFQDPYQAAKMFCDHIEIIPDPLASMLHEMNSPSVLQFLEALTGTEKLIPDPYLKGGGLHCSGPGGVLAPHTDFHFHPDLDLYRRYNAIVYLNPDWDVSDGGSLELFEEGSDEPEVTVPPAWGRCVIFSTDDRSVHGFTKPVRGDGRWRRSLALYYYTSTEAEKFSGDMSTYWRTHAKLNGGRRARLQLYKAFLFASRAFSSLAYRTNPNFVPPQVSERARPEAH